MKAVTYHDKKDVRVQDVPDPVLIDRENIILRVTATAICGSELHLYRGKIPDLHDGDILGHEFMGVVEEIGPEVKAVKKGNRVVSPFVIACGECFHCRLDEFSACQTTNTGKGSPMNQKGIKPPAALFGYSHLYGGIAIGQAQFVRVPQTSVGPLIVPDALADEQVLFLSGILPTGYQAVFGAGTVGRMSAACARMLGAERIFMVDELQYRPDFAQAGYGIVPINMKGVDDPAEVVISKTGGRGADATIDAVCFEAKGSTTETVLTTLKLEGSRGAALRQSIAATRRCDTVSIPGVYARFLHGFLFGYAFDKGLTFKMGQTHVQKLLPELVERIGEGLLKPEIIIYTGCRLPTPPKATPRSTKPKTTVAKSFSCRKSVSRT